MTRYLATLAPDPDRNLRPEDFRRVEAETIAQAAVEFFHRAKPAGCGPWSILVGRDQPENRWRSGLPIVVSRITLELERKETAPS